LDTRKPARRYYIAFMQFVSNMEAKSLRPRQGRILPLYSVGQRQPACDLFAEAFNVSGLTLSFVIFGLSVLQMM
jgi:hypothetical protein